MIPQETAKQLVDLFYQLFPLDKDVITTDGELHWEYNDWNQSKKAALIAVDEILEMDLPILEEDADIFYDYWQEVKQELKKL